MTRKLIAIVPAAGVGERARVTPSGVPAALEPPRARLLAGAPDALLPKQYGLLCGEPMLRWAVRALLADKRIEQVRVIATAGDEHAGEAVKGLPRTVVRFCGGPTRAATVTAALEDAGFDRDDETWVLVHDAARPGLPADALARLIDVCVERGQGGLLAQRVADTVKQGREAAPAGDSALQDDAAPRDPARPAGRRAAADVGSVAQTLPRQGLWLAQTPQLFPAAPLLAALCDANRALADVTDEASAMERAGHTPLLVPGSARNFKVTWPDDFQLMEKWLS